MRTRRGYWLSAVVMSAVVTACTTPAEPLETPALLTATTQACRAQIEYAIGRWMGAPVTLGTMAFSSESHIMIEHKQARDASGRVLDGRLLDKPEAFHLVRAGGKCIVVNVRTFERAIVDACTCRD